MRVRNTIVWTAFFGWAVGLVWGLVFDQFLGRVLLNFCGLVQLGCMVSIFLGDNLSFEGGNKALLKSLVKQFKRFKPYEWENAKGSYLIDDARRYFSSQDIWTPPILRGGYEFRFVLTPSSEKYGVVIYRKGEGEYQQYVDVSAASFFPAFRGVWKYWKAHNFRVPVEMERDILHRLREKGNKESGELSLVEE